MSSVTSRAPPSAAGWQQSSNTNDNRSSRHQTPQQSVQTSPYNSKIQNKQVDVPRSSYEAQDSIDSTDGQSSGPYDSLGATAQFESQGLHSNLESSSQYYSYGSYLTPDHGSENPFSESSYTSPSIDEFLWQESFNTFRAPDNLDDDGALVSNIFSDIDQNGVLQGIVPKESQIQTTEPQLPKPPMSTTTTTMTRSLSPAQERRGQPYSSSTKMTTETAKRPRTSDQEGESQNDRFSRSTNDQQTANTRGQSVAQITRPSVLISSYSRGDSPARTELPMARSLSKRSQGSRLSDKGETTNGHDAGATDITSSSSMLMPPDQYADAEWVEGDDEEYTRAGIAPVNRNTATVPSLKDMEKQRELDETLVGVENWLATSETGSPTKSEFNRGNDRNRSRRERIRSRSTGARADLQNQTFSDKHIPGPGVLIDVDSENEYSDDGSTLISSEEYTEKGPDSPPAKVDPIDPATEDSYFPLEAEDSIAPEDLEPLPRQFYRRGPWQDPLRFAGTTDSTNQPPTANHAIMQYDQQAAKFETASRAATWGTRRRLSDSEIASIVDGSKVRHLSLSQKTRDRGNSIISRARTVIRRSSSNIKKSKEHLRRNSNSPHDPERSDVSENDPNQTVTSPIQQVQRTFSWGKSKSPPLHSTGGALLAMTGQLTAVGGSTVGASVEPPPERPKSPFLSALKRSRSKSDLPKSPRHTPGLSDLFNMHGGPPVPTLASPMAMRNEPAEPSHPTKIVSHDEDDMDEDNDEEVAVKMELAIQADNIIPNLDGFRTHARQLNPRLAQYLVERIAQDQLRRYKKLVKNKIDHTRSVQLKQQCSSGPNFCVGLGGKPKILPPRTSSKDANVNYAQFKVGTGGDSDGDEGAFVEGVVTPALFPTGIPLPPATHLPAEFECPLCFQVKKFQKPSDWTKHVHEDVQPFSCTFPNCPEPKSFKRKADWVRHENERHRHLEWWKCSIQECAHICYRKDNFVQHLVREHKMSEPKAKGARPTGGKARPAARSFTSQGQDPDDFWHLVEHCRHDTTSTPRNEPCKFCGNVCSTWKKLSVHVGKHMEQIAMPVLQLAERRAITADTVISPIDPPNLRMSNAVMLDTTGLGGSMDALSPYAASGVSMYQSSSAGQSPVPVNSTHSHGSSSGQLYYNQAMMPNGMTPMSSDMQQHPGRIPYPTPDYTPYSSTSGNYQNFEPVSHQANAYTQQPTTQGISAPYQTHHIMHSQPLGPEYGTLNVDTMQGPMYDAQQYYPNSAPGGGYMGNFGDAMSHNDGLHSPQHVQAQHMQNSTTGSKHAGNEYLYSSHPGTQSGRPYY